MRWSRRFIACCSPLLIFSFAGCKKVIRINVDPSLAPLSATTVPGATLEWAATSRDESFDVVFDSGLCNQKSPLHASYDRPAVCVVPLQQFGPGHEFIFYGYHIEGTVNGKPTRGPREMVAIGPTGCHQCR